MALKMSDAMILKREIMKNCNIDAKILETSKDGFFLRVENSANKAANSHKLMLALTHNMHLASVSLPSLEESNADVPARKELNTYFC